MKALGKITFYNGKFGTISKDDEAVAFERKDISLNQKLQVGDTVEFRLEERVPNIKIARNITIFKEKGASELEDECAK